MSQAAYTYTFVRTQPGSRGVVSVPYFVSGFLPLASGPSHWRRPPYPIATADYATYVQIVTWFLDTPSPEAPFSAHKMALAGKELGTDVRQWFEPSVAAGAIRILTTAFPECGLYVAVVVDSTLYQNQVFAASHGETTSRSPRRQHGTMWGDRPVLLLLGIRLGIEGVNPIYYDTIKLLYTFPQSVGIAGGLPSSSYYFVGSQADNLLYLDPYNPRPVIPLRPPPKVGVYEGRIHEADHHHSDNVKHQEKEKDRSGKKKKSRDGEKRSSTSPTPQHYRVPTSPSSTRTGSSNCLYHAPVSPSPLQQQYSSSSADSSAGSGRRRAAERSWKRAIVCAVVIVGDGDDVGWKRYPGSGTGTTESMRSASASQPTSPVQIAKSHSATGSSSHHSNYLSSVDHHHHQHQHYGLVPTTPSDVESNSRTHAPSSAISGSANDLDPIQLHYCTVYSAAELKTFHCERVRKMPMSGLDPSMLIGFLVRDEKDWRDFRRRVGKLPRTIFSVQDEAPTWPSDSDDNMGLESISEPDDLDLDDDEEGLEVQGEDDEEGDEGEIEQFFETRSRSASSASNAGQESSRRGSRQSEEVDTEEDPVGPMTPGPGSKFDIVSPPRRGKGKGDEGSDLAFRAEDGDGFGEDVEEEESDIEDDWVDPSLPTYTDWAAPAASDDNSVEPESEEGAVCCVVVVVSAVVVEPASGGSSKKGKKQVPVPVPSVRLPAPPPQEHYPFPVTPPPPDDNDDYSFASNLETSSSVGAPRYTRDGRTRNVSMKSGAQAQGQGQHQHQHRMHNARARDGGRMQSSAVKGILTDS
ncbi:hypothetical protein CPC08DRAFT_770477 [Agrocybe pediades]|nr:hypothetical protein CPC08DRAFT_770477 [Agrocybe pediades]